MAVSDGRPADVPEPTRDDRVDDVAGFGDRRLGEPIDDCRPDAATLDEPGRPEDGQVLARVGQSHSDGQGQVADRAFADTQSVEEHQPLRVGQDLAHVGMQAVEVEGVLAEVHGLDGLLGCRAKALDRE